MLRKPEDWCKIKDIFIMDPDGWRRPGDPSWDTPLTEEDFNARMMVSTIGPRKMFVKE